MAVSYDQSVVQQVEALIAQAHDLGASDIHLEPSEKHLRIRFRIDGVLYDQPKIERSLMSQILSRFKVLANMDIAEKRIPQDGKFTQSRNKKQIDFRVSSFPSLFGEKIVVRILDRSAHAVELEHLGFDAQMLQTVRNLAEKQNGFFLVTGPTGSGKTTTLYGMLAYTHTPQKNIATLEDPVEYHLEGITQGHINPAAGFTFETGIRALLRQDPDILMVGEIRDKQTARVAIEAALTGHLVLSTLHTNNAPGAIMRLMDMGIEPFLINAAVTGVLAQRLVRTLCNECKEQRESTPEHRALCSKLGIEELPFYESTGCSWCNKLGFKGRTGIFELLVISPGLRSLVVSQPKFDEIYEQCIKDGMKSLLQDGIEKVQSGEVSLEELVRVIS